MAFGGFEADRWCFGQYVKALNVSMVMLVAAHTLDIAMYQRINRMVGIPDWVFMLGATQ